MVYTSKKKSFFHTCTLDHCRRPDDRFFFKQYSWNGIAKTFEKKRSQHDLINIPNVFFNL